MQNSLFKKGLVLGIILLVTVVVPSNGNASSGPSSDILCVGGAEPGSYSGIQDAIDDASDDATVFVYNGTYYENIIVNKSITLVGENRDNTIINGRQKGDTIHITSEHVILSGFAIVNGSGKNWFNAGIRLTASNVTIHRNNICNNMLGIFGKRVNNITIYDNRFINDSVTFSLYDNETKPVPFCENYFVHNLYNNTVNGKKLYYYKYQNNIVVPQDAGQIIAVSCKNMIIRRTNLINADYGCILVNCVGCLLEYSNISSGDGMLWLIHSRNNKIQHNQISHNFEGICIDIGSTRNIIQYNTIANNQLLGIILEDGSNYNTIYKNNFIRNDLKYNWQACFSFCHFNKWRRNYWDGAKILPKAIFGSTMIGHISIPLVNFDLHPAIKPYKI